MNINLLSIESLRKVFDQSEVKAIKNPLFIIPITFISWQILFHEPLEDLF